MERDLNQAYSTIVRLEARLERIRQQNKQLRAELKRRTK